MAIDIRLAGTDFTSLPPIAKKSKTFNIQLQSFEGSSFHSTPALGRRPSRYGILVTNIQDRFTSSAFVRTTSHARQPIRSFVVSKIVPVAMGDAVFGWGGLGKSFHELVFAFQNKNVS